MSKKSNKLELEGKDFWILVGDSLTLFSDKDAAMLELREVMTKQPNATLAAISYSEKGGKKGESDKGTFTIEPLDWKEIALSWVQKGDV